MVSPPYIRGQRRVHRGTGKGQGRDIRVQLRDRSGYIRDNIRYKRVHIRDIEGTSGTKKRTSSSDN
jgi:hypothetical protein